MNTKQVQRSKKSVARVMGVHRGLNYKEPYRPSDDVEFGGTAFFVDPRIFGDSFPIETENKRFALTNFHVVDELFKQKCYLGYPEKGKSQISASVVFVVPELDVAILMVDPEEEHPLWFDSESVASFMKGIPNLAINERPVKGNSQNVVAIGFPNLSSDYQLCEGCISGRGHSMLQISISLNGGNSGGPLLLNGRVVGICTASVYGSEALGLAVPIVQTIQFFKYWTDFSNIILRLPTWGITTRVITDDFLDYFDVSHSMKGCGIQKVIPNSCIHSENICENDIILSVKSDANEYVLDNFGLVSVDWTDKRVKFDNNEFILSLNPLDITFDVFEWKTKTVRRGIRVIPKHIDYKIRTEHHCWESIHYCILGGLVFMNLSKNHLEYEDEDELEYDDEDYSMEETSSLTQFAQKHMHLKSAVIVTHVPAQTHVSANAQIHAFDIIKKCNGEDVENIEQFQKMIKNCVQQYNKNKTRQSDFIALETNKDKIYLRLETLKKREVQDAEEDNYPKNKCQLLKMSNRKKRKRIKK